MDNERLQEIFLMIGDKLAPVRKFWWYALAIGLLAAIPSYYLLKYVFVGVTMASYRAPKIIYAPVVQEPLQLIDQQIFSFPAPVGDTYSGYIKIKNINLEWGVADQSYTAEFKTYGGTLVTKITGKTFILPASEKMIIFSRFSSKQKPDVLEVTLDKSHFIFKPDVSFTYQLDRVNFQNNPDGLVISAGIKNLSPFTVSEINLPVAVYNNRNEIVGVNFTYINAVASGETRTFQYAWPMRIPDAARAEILPEVNIFNRSLFSTSPGASPFEQGGP
jgi:hypothetical protein